MTPLQWALTYARRGWPVFPCNPRTKQPLVQGDRVDGKLVPNTGGVHRASVDEVLITQWWTRWPKALIGIKLGAEAGMFAVDLDAGTDDDTGEVFEAAALLDNLERALGEKLPDTFRVRTPRGGWHFYFRFPAGELDAVTGKPLGNRAALLGPGSRIDIRGAGGYTVLPPSVRSDGVAYTWERKPVAKDDLPAEAPRGLLDLVLRKGKWSPELRAPDTATQAAPLPKPAGGAPRSARAHTGHTSPMRAYLDRAVDACLDKLRNSPKGSRNDDIFHTAIHLAQLVAGSQQWAETVDQLDAGAVRASIEAIAKAWPNFQKSRGTIASGWSKGIREPRDLRDVGTRTRDALDASTLAAGPPDPSPPPLDDWDCSHPGGIAAGGSGGSHGNGSGGAGGELPPGGDDGGDGRNEEAEELFQRSLDLQLAHFPMTDLGNAERFRRRVAGKLIHSEAIGWISWDRRRYGTELADSRAVVAVHDMARAIQHEAAALRSSDDDIVVKARPAPRRKSKKEKQEHVVATARELADQLFDGAGGKVAGMISPRVFEDPDDDDDEGDDDAPGRGDIRMSHRLAQFGRDSEESRRLTPVLKQAKAYLEVPVRQLDADPYMINVLNGTVVAVRSPDGKAHIRFKRHEQRDLITKLAPVIYDPDAVCPEYDAFLEMVQPSPVMRRFLHQWGGYSLTGDTSEQKLTFNWGKGQNGKSTLFNAWGYCAGDYGKSIAIETFLDQGKPRQGGAATPDLAGLAGVRYLRTSEPERGAKLAEALIKLATGGEPMSVRHLNRSFFEMVPAFKLTMSGNHKPGISGTDDGIWRRVRLVPWLVKIPEDKRVKDFDKLKLKPETSGILNRLLAGLVDWLENGLIEPPEVIEATAEYRRDSDPLGRMLDACTVADSDGRVQASKLHAVFSAWARANGENEWKSNGLGRAMKERGFRSHHSSVNYWLGIRLVKDEHDFVDAHGQPLKPDVGWSPSSVSPKADDDVIPF